MDLVDLQSEYSVLLLSLAWPPATPSVEPTAGDLEDLAHHADPEGLPMILHEPELHFWSSAKYAKVDSIGECNIIGSTRIKGDVASGSKGTTGFIRVTEGGIVAAMEEGRVT